MKETGAQTLQKTIEQTPQETNTQTLQKTVEQALEEIGFGIQPLKSRIGKLQGVFIILEIHEDGQITPTRPCLFKAPRFIPRGGLLKYEICIVFYILISIQASNSLYYISHLLLTH